MNKGLQELFETLAAIRGGTVDQLRIGTGQSKSAVELNLNYLVGWGLARERARNGFLKYELSNRGNFVYENLILEDYAIGGGR